MSRRIRPDRNVYVGSYAETPCRRIDLPFTRQSLSVVLEWGAHPESSPYTHQEIAHWCGDYYSLYLNDDAEFDAVSDILEDVDAQWSLHNANTYSLEELQSLDFTGVRLPSVWFCDWLDQLRSAEQELPPDAQDASGRFAVIRYRRAGEAH